MALTDYAEYVAKRNAPFLTVSAMKVPSGNPSSWSSYWRHSPLLGAIPTTPVAPTRLTPGALNPDEFFNADAAATLYLAAGELNLLGSVNYWPLLILCDRLSHQGGLDATVPAVPQTTNLPTAALTRYTDGIGVIGFYEVYTAIGTTGTTITCSYTNQAGTAGQVSQPSIFGIRQVAHSMFPIYLAAGDTGIKSIESVTLAGSTLTAGNFGVTLLKPLIMFPARHYQNQMDAVLNNAFQFVPIQDDACLYYIWYNMAAGQAGPVVTGTLSFIEA